MLSPSALLKLEMFLLNVGVYLRVYTQPREQNHHFHHRENLKSNRNCFFVEFRFVSRVEQYEIYVPVSCLFRIVRSSQRRCAVVLMICSVCFLYGEHKKEAIPNVQPDKKFPPNNL
jgi:hypothetical protein